MLQLSIWIISSVLTLSSGTAEPEPAEDKKAETLIARMIDKKASWEDRCKAEDDLAKLKPEIVMPRVLRHAAKSMPPGGIYNSAGRESDKRASVAWQIWYAVGRSWSEQAGRLPFETGGELLVELLSTASNDAEKGLVMRELRVRWSPKSETPASKILLDPAAAIHLRVSAAWALVEHGKQAYQDDLLKIFARVPHADRFDWFEALTSQRNKKKTGIDPRVVVRGFELLQHEDQLFKKEVAKRLDAFHGAYFATNWLADYLGEKFQPNPDDPRYNNTGRRDPRWFADTVTNALAWWEKNQGRYR